MHSLEKWAVGLLLGILCPLLAFVSGWWTSVLLFRNGLLGSEEAIRNSALVCLVIGLVLNLLFLRRWIAAFYSAPLLLMATIYAVLCPVAVAFFMGLPVGTLLLGFLAGLYIGRRACHQGRTAQQAKGSFVRTSLLAASLTAGASFLIGLWVLADKSVQDLVHELLGIPAASVYGYPGFILVALLSIILFVVQYSGTLFLAQLAIARVD